MNINSIQELNNLQKILKTEIEQVFKEELQNLTDDTLGRVPVQTGHLKDSFQVVVNGTKVADGDSGNVSGLDLNSNSPNEINIEYTAEYAEAVHEHSGNFFLSEPINKLTENLKKSLNDKLNKL